MQQFDLIVIGSGSGLEVSLEAAALGLSVAIIEEGPFGGTYLNRVASLPRCSSTEPM